MVSIPRPDPLERRGVYGSTTTGGHYNGGVLFRLEDDEGIQFAAPAFTSRGPSATALVTVTRAKSTPDTAVVEYATSSGSAAEGVEYVAAIGQLTFAPGVKTKTFAVKVLPPGPIEETGPSPWPCRIPRDRARDWDSRRRQS